MSTVKNDAVNLSAHAVQITQSNQTSHDAAVSKNTAVDHTKIEQQQRVVEENNQQKIKASAQAKTNAKEEQAALAVMAASKTKVSAAQLEKVAQQLQDFVSEMNRGLEFLVDEDSGRDVIKVIDRETGDLVKQFPSEDVLALVAKLSEATGNLVDAKI